MSGKRKQVLKYLQWQLECMAHSLMEVLAGLIPGPWVFRLGKLLGVLAWHLFPRRQKIVLRNLRIALAGEKELPELRRMARETFLRTAANLISAAHTARLSPAQLAKVIRVENLEYLERAVSGKIGVVLLLSHMGNWEVLSRIIHFFPKGSKAGAYYRPLNNRLLDKRVLDRRQADGTRMFAKLDNPLHVAGFLREGGIVGILADQRVGRQGDPVSFFGRLTRASPLPSLLARRSKSEVLALSLESDSPGHWVARFHEVKRPHVTEHCMEALESAMKRSIVDVFWLQERWKVYIRPEEPIGNWLEPAKRATTKPHRALIWLVGAPEGWRLPEGWIHPDVVYEAALVSGEVLPSWLSASTVVHTVGTADDCKALRKSLDAIDGAAALPLDFILTAKVSTDFAYACRRESIPHVSLP